MTEQFYFVCSIGPVQDFIKTARTSQDLWFGSWMLSELAKAAAKVLKDDGHILIFPAPEKPEDLNSQSEMDMSNKVVAIITSSPKMVGERVQSAIKNHLDALAKLSFDAVEAHGNFKRSLAEAQLGDLTEFFWAAAPLNGDYAKARKRAEALLSARKNTRDFQQAQGQGGLPKSSLDGFRESVLLIKTPEKEDPFWMFKAEKGEALSGVDLMKRWGKRVGGVNFESTTDIAVLPFRQGLGETRYQTLLDELKHLRESLGGAEETDGTHFYEDRMAQLIPDENVDAFRKGFGEAFKSVAQRPSPYYALLQADGDNMGQTIDAQAEKEKHSALSQALSEFDKQAKAIIAKYKGIPVYVGGDDVLAYLPLHTALICVQELSGAFGKAMRAFTNLEGKSSTLSVGLAIAHHLKPLSDVLEQARKAEKAAKKVDGKNGLVISMSKRSGSDRQVTGKLGELAEHMETLICFTQQKAISHGAAYELEELQRRLDIPELDKAILHKEAVRVIGRKRESGWDEKAGLEIRTQLERWLDENLTLTELAGEMVIAAELAKAYDMAGILPKEKTA